MDGQTLKRKVEASGLQMKVVAERMGITPQSLCSIFNTKDIKVTTIERMADALGIPVVSFFGEKPSNSIIANGSIIGSGDGNSVHTDAQQYLSLLAKKDEQMDRLISVIERLTEGQKTPTT